MSLRGEGVRDIGFYFIFMEMNSGGRGVPRENTSSADEVARGVIFFGGGWHVGFWSCVKWKGEGPLRYVKRSSWSSYKLIRMDRSIFAR